MFAKSPHKPKAFEVYEKNKLTIKFIHWIPENILTFSLIRYASVLEAYMQITKDIQRLESHVNSFSLERERSILN